MGQGKRIRWPVRWSKTEENLIEQVARQTGFCPTQFIRTVSLNKAAFLKEKASSESEEAPQTNEEILRRKIFDYKVREGWVETATGLQKTAEILKSSQSEKERVNLLWHELMLWGFCLENLLKGLYSKKQSAGLLKNKQAKPLNKEGELSSTKRDHDLEKWCQRAEVTNFVSAEQKRILRNLTQIIIHHGRYPVSIKWNKSESVYWECRRYDRILMQMITFLKQEMDKIELENA